MLKAGYCVSGVARYYNCHSSAIQHLRDCYQATRTVKGRHRPGQLRMATDIKTATNVNYIDDININDFVPAGYQHCQMNSRAPRVICFRFLLKKYFITITLNYAKFQDKFQITALKSKGYYLLIDCCPIIVYHFDMKFKSHVADILMFI